MNHRNRVLKITNESNHNGPCFAIRERKPADEGGYEWEWNCWTLTLDEAVKVASGMGKLHHSSLK